jgi:hypothetical protein
MSGTAFKRFGVPKEGGGKPNWVEIVAQKSSQVHWFLIFIL